MGDSLTKKGLILSLSLTAICTLGIGGIGGYVLCMNTRGVSDEESKILSEYEILKDHWLFGDDELAEEAAMGLLMGPSQSKDDPYTFYTSTASAQGLNTSGKGFGFTSRSYDGGLYITDVYNGPALNRLQIGDVIYGVTRGNEGYYDFTVHSLSDINSYLSENSDTSTVYTFNTKRKDANLSVSLTKGDYSQILAEYLTKPDGASSLPEGTYAVKINTFLGTPAAAMAGLLSAHKGNIQHLIIDLRGNGGGDVYQAELLCNMFVKKGTLIYQMRDKNNAVIEERYQEKDPAYQIDKFSILIDGRSASASEIFTLAMRAGANTTVYGLNSYGKGIAQKLISFSDGSVMRYTYAYVYGPERENETMYDEASDSDSVMCIHGKGIIPDVVYPDNYLLYDSGYDYSQTLGISELYQNYFLDMMNALDSEAYPDSYSASYHFTDAVSQFASCEEIDDVFADDGKVSKKVADRFLTRTYDLYLKSRNELTKEVWEA